jgi:hypothetical protein
LLSFKKIDHHVLFSCYASEIEFCRIIQKKGREYKSRPFWKYLQAVLEPLSHFWSFILDYTITVERQKIRNLTDMDSPQRTDCEVITDAIPTPFDTYHSSSSSHDLLEREIVGVGGRPTAHLLAFGMVIIPLAVIAGPQGALLGIGFAGISFLRTAP